MRNGCEDWEFWIRVMTAGYRGATIPAVLHRYRQRQDSMSRRMRTGDTWFDVYGGLLNKYPEAREEHLLDMLLRREWTIGRLVRAIDAVRQELPLSLEPELEQRKRELETARARLAAKRERDEELADLKSQARTLAEESSGAKSQVRTLARDISCARARRRCCPSACRGTASVVELANHRAMASTVRAAVSRPLHGRAGS